MHDALCLSVFDCVFVFCPMAPMIGNGDDDDAGEKRVEKIGGGGGGDNQLTRMMDKPAQLKLVGKLKQRFRLLLLLLKMLLHRQKRISKSRELPELRPAPADAKPKWSREFAADSADRQQGQRRRRRRR